MIAMPFSLVQSMSDESFAGEAWELILEMGANEVGNVPGDEDRTVAFSPCAMAMVDCLVRTSVALKG